MVTTMMYLMFEFTDGAMFVGLSPPLTSTNYISGSVRQKNANLKKFGCGTVIPVIPTIPFFFGGRSEGRNLWIQIDEFSIDENMSVIPSCVSRRERMGMIHN